MRVTRIITSLGGCRCTCQFCARSHSQPVRSFSPWRPRAPPAPRPVAPLRPPPGRRARSLSAGPAARQLGRWTVAPVGPASYRLTWHSPTRIPTTDAAVRISHGGSLATGGRGMPGRGRSPWSSRPRPRPTRRRTTWCSAPGSSTDPAVTREPAPTGRRTAHRRPARCSTTRAYPAPTRSCRRTTSSRRSSCPASAGSRRWSVTSWRRPTRPTPRPWCSSCTVGTGPATHRTGRLPPRPRAPRTPRSGPARRGRSRSRAISATTTCSAGSPVRATSPCRSRPTPSTPSTSRTLTAEPQRAPL